MSLKTKADKGYSKIGLVSPRPGSSIIVYVPFSRSHSSHKVDHVDDHSGGDSTPFQGR